MLIANNVNLPITIKASPLENELISTDSETLSRIISQKENKENQDEE